MLTSCPFLQGADSSQAAGSWEFSPQKLHHRGSAGSWELSPQITLQGLTTLGAALSFLSHPFFKTSGGANFTPSYGIYPSSSLLLLLEDFFTHLLLLSTISPLDPNGLFKSLSP